MSRASALSGRLRASLVLHGAVVIGLGLLAGIPFALVVTGDLAGEVRAWRMAHMEGILNGLVMVAVAAAGGSIHLSPGSARWLWAGLLVAGYGNVVASVVAAAFGVRGLAATGPPANLVVFALFSAAIAGVLAGLGLAARGALRARGAGDG